MKKDTKKAAALIIALGKKPMQHDKEDAADSMGPDSEPAEGEVDEGKMSAAEDMISALDNKDAEALVAALDAFMDCR